VRSTGASGIAPAAAVVTLMKIAAAFDLFILSSRFVGTLVDVSMQ
jgi:hypothetical protein